MWGGYFTLCKRRSYQLLVPFILWSLIKWLLSSAHSFSGFFYSTFISGGFFWFLWALWAIPIIFLIGEGLSQMLNIKNEFIIGVIALILVGIMVVLDFRMFGFQFIAYYFMFYAFGYYCNKYKQLLTSNKYVMGVIFLIWFVLGSFWNMHDLPLFLRGIPFVPSTMLQYAYRFATAFVAIYLIFSAAPMLLNAKNKANEKVAHIGQISLGIYVVHLTLIIPMSPWLVRILPNVPMVVVILISFLLASIISITIVELLNKNKYTSRYLLGKI